uniref:Leucine Rich Repeat family protein, expressed n=1 Tax=Oryza sativa subsp. japonica TaxID=39947 RepID=Q2R1N9_ORYSJ|nr:Leucine Rich Repeat family protein, expressed [Oryza sativa Japonica Group]
MTELASGAVSSLLVVIRNEAALLGGVRDDVRLLAQDCNNCIDLYLYSGNPEIHRAKGRLRRHLWWAYWYLRKMVAQHRAAIQLCQLKDRARDVGERRMRYGVEVPATTKAAAPDAEGGYAAGDDEDYEDHSARRAVYEPPALEDYVNAKLLEWAEEIPPDAIETLSIAIVAPDTDNKEVLDLARDTLVVPGNYYHRSITVNVPAVHADFLPLRPKEILYYILRELEPGSQKHVTYQGDPWQDYYNIYCGKKRVLHKIKRNIEKMNVYKKLEKIKSDIKDGQHKSDKQLLLQLQKKGVDQVDLHVLVQLLLLQSQQDQANNKAVDMYKLPEWNYDNIMKIARKLKKHMEADEELNEQISVEKRTTKQGGGGENKEEKDKGDGDREEGKEENEKDKGEADGEGEQEEEMKDKEKGGEERKEEPHHEKQEHKKEKEVKEEERKEEQNKEKEEREGTEEKQVGGGEKKEEKEDGDDDGVIDDNYDEEEEEEEEDDDPIHLHEAQYVQILLEVFPKITSSKAQQQDKSEAKQATNTATTTLDEVRIKQMINDAKRDILRELRGGKSDKNEATGEPDVPPDKNQPTGEHAGVPDQNGEACFEELELKIEEIKQELKEQLKIKGIVDKIKHHLQGECPLIILKVDDMMDGSRWEEFRRALSLLECSADALIFTTESTEQAKGYCYPPREPIDHCSHVGLYHHTVLELTSKQKNKSNYDPRIFLDILKECEGHEFCMRIFTHAVYANPKKSTEELSKLHSTLQDSQKSFDAIAKNMLMYSYNDLPKEYKSCLLYLAIFPKGQKIRRSTLIGRWVTEGLTFKEDWPSSVRQANQCFDALIRRWLVYPADIGATGKIKSCEVGDLVHGFITTIARKQHIVETRLSHHLARHFSIFNDLRLRSSDRIQTFFQSLSQSSRVSLLKVLDLEGCQCFGVKNQRYLKDICNKMLLLKYLSLKGTNITQLPREINCLRELEVLDIRETMVPANATVNVLLLKLKRLLAGHIDPSLRNFRTSVHIPHRIDKMVNIEVLSNVKAQRSDDLEDIGKLWQLRKLGVVINAKKSHLEKLLKAISDLHECIRSLTITIPTTTLEGTPSNPELPDHIDSNLPHPKKLESLSISGARYLFPLLIKSDNNKLAKVTLSSTQLNQDDLEVLAKLPKLQCVRLRHISCTESMLIFKKDDFKCLKYLLIEGFNLTNITFENRSACELEKMVLSSTSIESISGVDRLPKFKELELNNSPVPNEYTVFLFLKKQILCSMLDWILKLNDELGKWGKQSFMQIKYA